MTIRAYGLAIMLLITGCGGDRSPTDTMTSPTNVASVNNRIGTTHLFGRAPDTTTSFGPMVSVIGPGVELRNFGATVFVNGKPTSGFVDIDFSATNILIRLTRDQSLGYFDMLRFADVDGSLRSFADVRINPETDYANFNVSRIHVLPDLIDVNLTALHGLRGQTISLAVDLSPVQP